MFEDDELTLVQRKKIREYLIKTSWEHINDIILTDKQRRSPDKMRAIAFEMEEIFKSIAAKFGLIGLSGK